MEEEFYSKCFELFRKVAWRINSDLARDESRCREVFHDWVLYPSGIHSPEEANRKLKFVSWKFKRSADYTNWLYTIFKHAILSYLRSETRREKVVKKGTDDFLSSFRDPDTPAPGETQQFLKERAASILKKFSCKEKELLALRYLEGKTQQEVGRFFEASTSAVSRWESKIKEKLAAAIEEKGRELEENQQIDLVAFILEKVGIEDAQNEESK